MAAVCALSVGARFGGDLFEESGELRSHNPPENIRESIDDELKVVTWNMHGEILNHLDDIREIVATRNTDVFSFQEVSETDYEALQEELPDWSLHFVVADSSPDLVGPAQGNLLAAPDQRIRDVFTRTIDGTNPLETAVGTVAGIGSDLRNIPERGVSFENTVKGKQEDRAAIFGTVTIWDADTGKEWELMIGGSHVSGNAIHDEQLTGLLDIIRDAKDEDIPMVVAADFNESPGGLWKPFLKLGMEVDGYKTDSIATYPAETLTEPEVAVIDGYQTDHVPVEMVSSTDSPFE